MSRYLSPREYAEIVGVDPDTVRTWIASGELGCIVTSANKAAAKPRYRIRPVDIERFENRRAIGPTPKTKPKRRRKKRDQQVLDIIR